MYDTQTDDLLVNKMFLLSSDKDQSAIKPNKKPPCQAANSMIAEISRDNVTNVVREHVRDLLYSK